MTAAQQVEPNPVQPTAAGKSYFWTDTAITGGVLTGIVMLGLWGDVAIGSVILGIQLLCAGWHYPFARSARTHPLGLAVACRRIWAEPGRPEPAWSQVATSR